MKLSWLSTSEAHKHTSMYLIQQYESMHKIKRERERESQSQWIKRKQRDLFRGSSTQLYVSALTEKDFQSTNLSTQDSHTGNLHQGFGAIQPGVHNSSLNQIQPLTRGNAQPNQSPPHTRGVGTQPSNHKTPLHQEGYKSQLHLSLEGANHNLNLYT